MQHIIAILYSRGVAGAS